MSKYTRIQVNQKLKALGSSRLVIAVATLLLFLPLIFGIILSSEELTNGTVCNKSSSDILVLSSTSTHDENLWLSPSTCTDQDVDVDAIWGKQCDPITNECRVQMWKVGPHHVDVIDSPTVSAPSGPTLFLEGLCLMRCGWEAPDRRLKPYPDDLAFNLATTPSLSIMYMELTLVRLIAHGFDQVLHCEDLPATIVGSRGDDIIHGTAGPDVIVGLNGNDILYGYDGSDRLCGNEGNDKLIGGNGSDWLTGTTGDDAIVGDAGDDILEGGAGIDFLDGGSHIFGNECNRWTRLANAISDTLLNCGIGRNVVIPRD